MMDSSYGVFSVFPCAWLRDAREGEDGRGKGVDEESTPLT